LITAGPTWVAVDNVRVISNTATGITGILLAEKLLSKGARVTLLLGPSECCCLDRKIRLLRFRFFEELEALLARELKTKRYDIVIHSAAVSDYKPKLRAKHKVKSGLRNWRLALVPTPKIIDRIKRFKPGLFLVGFKFEPGSGKNSLIKNAGALMRRSRADLVVANSIEKKGYRAFIHSRAGTFGPFKNKKSLINNLIAKL